MALPTTTEFTRPVLEIIAQHKIINKARKIVPPLIAEKMGLTKDSLQERVSSGRLRANVRCDWAFTILEDAGLIEFPHSGAVKITNAGERFLEHHSGVITRKNLRQCSLHHSSYSDSSSAVIQSKSEINSTSVLEEMIETATNAINAAISKELFNILLSMAPSSFERLALDLIVSVYGDKNSTIKHTGSPRDLGIDGIILLDKFGFEKIHVQAKRWQNDVSHTELHKFMGALIGENATRGIFVTTAKFTGSAIDYAENNSSKLVIIDGNTFIRLMIEHRVGVNYKKTIPIPIIDSNYFNV